MNKNGAQIRAFLFLRDPYFVENEVSGALIYYFSIISIEKERDLYRSEGPSQAKRLTQFKDNIAQSGFPLITYNRPAHLSDIVYFAGGSLLISKI